MKIAMGGYCQPHLTRPFTKRSSFSIPSSSPPPREVKIGKRWEELQGSKNWKGLLDPLDEALREEILRYGKFVEATYKSFDFDPSSPTYGTCIHPKHSLLQKSGLPHTGYRVTRNLHATSGIQLPHWTKALPSWVSSNSSWIGFVAVCQDEKEIARLGRRDVVVAYRGTATCLEWLENLRATLTEIPFDHVGPPASVSGSMVESGFQSLYTSETKNCPSLRHEIKEEIGRVIQSYGNEPLSFTITGHSLGAALATLTAYDITTTFQQKPPVTVMSFGGPCVGNKSFRSQVEKHGSKILRLVNSTDVITKVPGFVVNEDVKDEEEDDIHVAGLPLPRWLHKRAENSQWVYADVGHELGLSSVNSPLLPGQTNPATCHELDTYLHLVNGFESTTCPFKASAKKMLKECKKKKTRNIFSWSW